MNDKNRFDDLSLANDIAEMINVAEKNGNLLLLLLLLTLSTLI